MTAVSRLQILQAQKVAKAPLEKQKALDFVLDLFEMFGHRFGKVIRGELGDFQPLFDEVHASFYEIQKRLANGVGGFTEQDCPETFKIVDGYRLGNREDLEFYADLKEKSYGTLPFPQKVLILYKNPELDVLAKVEAVRSRAFYQIVGRLRIEVIEEEKGKEPPPPRPPPKPLSADDEMGMTKFYFGAGAIVYDRRVVYFSEMGEMWKAFDDRNGKKVEDLLAQMKARGWAESALNPVMAFMKYHQKGLSFEKFLILCSVEAVQRNLGMEFSPTMTAKLEDWFESEETRSDFCYLTSSVPLFYELDFAKFNRISARRARPFQLYYFIKRNFGVKAPHGLLLMLTHMDPRWNEKELPSFCARRWQQVPPIPPAEIEEFRVAFDGFQRILNCVAKRPVSLVAPTPEDEALLKNTDCWDLLFYLWKDPRRANLIQAVTELGKLPGFSMTIDTVLKFFRENQEWFRPERTGFYVGCYREAVQSLTESGVQAPGTQHIFFEPAFEVLQTMSIKFGTAADSTKRFVAAMKEYPDFPMGEQYYLMLRQYILHPSSLMFNLLKDVPAIGARPTEALLWDVLSKSQEPFDDSEPIPKQETRARAIEITRKIQEAYHFTDVQIFSIYLEVIRLVIRKEEQRIWKFAQIIHDLMEFCPAVKKKDAYFLLRYHPDGPVVPPATEEDVVVAPGAPPQLVSVSPEHVAVLALMRDKWAKNEVQLNRFVVDQAFYNRVIDKIEQLVVPLGAACRLEHVGNKFEQTLQFSLLSAFYSPFQPLMDYFRITNITEIGARWGEPSWRGHLGQLKFILGESNIGIYLNWGILKGRPVLLISFIDILTGEATSAFIPLEVPAEEIAPNRVVFYGLLLAMGSQVLREKAEKSVPLNAPETPESWIPAFNGLAETLADYPEDVIPRAHVKKIWEFLYKVKLAYRKGLLHRIAKLRLPEFPSYVPRDVAAHGHIFSCHPRGSLLPKALFDLEHHPEFYVPDADGDFVASCRPLFSQEMAKSEPLNLDLNMPDGKHPISYQVQTIDQVTGEIEHRRERNDTAPPLEMVQGRYVTLTAKGVSFTFRYPPEALENPALFQRYFDKHNLLLKATVYNS